MQRHRDSKPEIRTPVSRGRPTVRDIAKVAGVSPSSVSRVLNNPSLVSGSTRERVQIALERMESTAAASHERVPTIGCVFMDHTSGPRFEGFDSTVWAGIAAVAMDHGCEVHLLNPDGRGRNDSIGDLCASRGIGALALRVDMTSTDLLDEVAECGIPAVVVAHKPENPALGYVVVRSRETSRDAINHLLRLGHTRIAFCRNIIPDQDHAERQAGYEDALRDSGIEPDDQLNITIPADPDGGMTAINRLLALPDPPTAVYFSDPMPTLGALRRAQALGIRVPEDLSIVGFDDDNARYHGGIVYTAVCQDVPRVARITGQVLLRAMLRGPLETPPAIELESYLEVNASTGPAPQSLDRLRSLRSRSEDARSV